MSICKKLYLSFQEKPFSQSKYVWSVKDGYFCFQCWENIWLGRLNIEKRTTGRFFLFVHLFRHLRCNNVNVAEFNWSIFWELQESNVGSIVVSRFWYVRMWPVSANATELFSRETLVKEHRHHRRFLTNHSRLGLPNADVVEFVKGNYLKEQLICWTRNCCHITEAKYLLRQY